MTDGASPRHVRHDLHRGADSEFTAGHRSNPENAYDRSEAVYFSPISDWEIGQLVSRGRLMLAQAPAQSSIERGRLIEAAMTTEILIASSFLPDSPLRDPADKIIAATAREFDYIVLTDDRMLLNYARKGHLRAIAC